MAYNDYKLVEGEDKALYYIREVKTDQVIKAFRSFSDARKFLKHLNMGGGFSSWTPTFFLTDTKKPL